MKKLRIISVMLLSLLVLFTITGFFVLPPVLTSVLTKNLSQALHRDVAIGQVKVNPYTLVLEVLDLSIGERDRPESFVSFGSLHVNAEWDSLFRRAPVVREVKLDRPSIRITRFEGGTYNFSDLIKGGEKREDSRPLSFSVSNIQVTNGTVVIDDQPVHKIHRAEGIALTIPFISNMPHYSHIFVQPSFQAIINGTPLVLAGKSKPFSESLESTLSLDLKHIDIPEYLAYLPVDLGFTIQNGLLDLTATATFRQFQDRRGPESSLTGQVVCRELAVIQRDGEPILSLPSLAVDLSPSQIFQKKFHVQKIAISTPELNVTRDKTGTLNLIEAFRKTSFREESPHREEGNGAAPVTLVIDEIILSGGKVAYTDDSGSSRVRIAAKGLSVTARGITTEGRGGGTIDVACSLNETGRLSLGTSFTMKPLTAENSLSLEGFQPAWVQPLFVEKMPGLIRRGTLATTGSLRIARQEGRTLQARFTGDVRVADFASVDRVHAEELVSWKDLAINGLDFSLNPGRLAIRAVTVSSPAALVIVNPDGTTNIGGMSGGRDTGARGTPPETQEASQVKTALESISVAMVTVKDGRFSFSDRSVTPRYTTSLTEITGSIAGLTSNAFRKADVNLAARLDKRAPLSITGSMNPLREDLFVDLAVTMKNMELTRVSPYSGKFAGYAVEKGKLSVDLKYFIDKKVLTAENDVLIDQFTFGESVESTHATKLPVKLAVALLKDSSGKIELHLPVSGRTDDPEFSVGKVILQTIVNILEKAATSPFALLGALYPGAAELNTIAFEPGKALLTDESRNKLSGLAKILQEKPSLNLELTGYVDTEQDRTGLVTTLFERKLKAVKLRDLLGAGKQAPHVDEIVIEPNEYSMYLKKAYAAETFDKPSSVLGMEKTLPDEEMKKLILDHISVSDDDLRDLAVKRSQRVQDELIETLRIAAPRVFLVEPDPFNPENQDSASAVRSRVSVTIR